MAQEIGFIGLGQMGRWMALNMRKAGFGVHVCDVDQGRVRLLTEEGAVEAASPAEAASRAAWLFLSLPHTEAVREVLFGPQGVAAGAKEGLIVADLSTISYLATVEIHGLLARRGIHFLDAPVSGMEARAREGTLTVMVGGEAALIETIRPALAAIGDRIVPMGAVGSGQLAKLINQLLFDVNCAALAEVLPMAAKLGLDPEKVSQVVTSGTGRSFAAEFFIPLILEGRFDEGYPIKNAYKDLLSAAEISAQRQIPLPLVNAATVTFQMALAEGWGDCDKGGLIRVFERLLGVEFRRSGKK